MKQNTTTNIDLQSKMRPFRDKDGNIEMDYDFAKRALEKIDEYSKTNQTPPNVNPKFVHWLRAGVKYVDDGKGTMAQYKSRHVIKEMGDNYDLICANTEARNAKLEKKGEFRSYVMQKIKGEAK